MKDDIKYMTIENLQWLQSVQEMAYSLYATNQMPDEDYRNLDNYIDNIVSRNGVSLDENNLEL